MVSLWCVIVLGGGVEGAWGGEQQLGWNLKLILWGLKLEDDRTNILCENCARVRCCHHFCERDRGVYSPYRSSAPVRITQGWHKFTSSLSPSNKTVSVKLCTPVSMKQPVKFPISVPDNGKEQKEKKVHHDYPPHTHTHKQAHVSQNYIQVILDHSDQFSCRISIISDHSFKYQPLYSKALDMDELYRTGILPPFKSIKNQVESSLIQSFWII